MIFLIIIFTTIYIVMQQAIRQEANFASLQLAEQARQDIKNGQGINQLIGQNTTEINSLSTTPFIIALDSNLNIVASSATLDGKMPSIPKGVITATKTQTSTTDGANKITWQPETGVRQAIVAITTKDLVSSNNKIAYIVTGQSLRLSENLVGQLGYQVFFGYLATVLVYLVLLATDRKTD